MTAYLAILLRVTKFYLVWLLSPEPILAQWSVSISHKSAGFLMFSEGIEMRH